MKRRALVAAAGASLALGAVPATAQASENDHCLHTVTPEVVLYCGCEIAKNLADPFLPPEAEWGCARP